LMGERHNSYVREVQKSPSGLLTEFSLRPKKTPFSVVAGRNS